MAVQSSWRRFAAAAAVAFASVSVVTCDGNSPTNPAPLPQGQVNAAGVPFPLEFFVEGHPDDWELFAGNQTASSALTAAKLVIVYVTSRDAGSGMVFPAFWQARETASKAAVDVITVAGDWTCASVTLNAHPIARCTKANTVSYYLRLPDGAGEGQGYGFGSLAQLRTGGVASLTAVDGTTTYTSWADIVSTFQALVAFEAAGHADMDVAVHAHDWDLRRNGSDHSDHRATADLTRLASVGRAWNLFWYLGLQSVFEAPNLTPDEFDIKWETIVAYDNVMLALMGETIIGTSHTEEWAQRTIFRSELSDGTPIPPIPPAVPRTPTNLLAAPVPGLPRLDVTWTDNASDEQGFRIERALDVPDGVERTYAQIASVGANILTYRNSGLETNVRYWYRVRAYNAIGTSAYSNEQPGMVAPPVAPSALTATANANGVRVDLAWMDNATDEQGFRIERAPDENGVAGVYVQIASAGANYRAFSISGLTTGTRYWFRVRAYNAIGTSVYSNEAGVTTLVAANAPSGLVATAVSGVRINLTWIDNSTDETSFRVERAADAGGVPGTFAPLASVGPNITTYGSINLQTGTRYWYRVRAGNPVGFSAYSDPASATTFAVPVAPSELIATPFSYAQIDLSWTDNSSDETAFRVERAPDVAGAPGTFAQVVSLGPNITTYSHTGLQGSTRYWYRIRAQSGVGNSPYSGVADATTLPPPPPPAAPTGLVATANASGVRIDLAWTDNAVDEQGFRIERAPDVSGVAGTYVQITSVAANSTTYANSGLLNGTRYWYRVRAYNTFGTSAYTDEASATTLTPPAAPTGLVATTFSGVRIDLAWTDNASDEQGFRIERAPDAGGVPGTFALVTTLATPNATTYSNTGLANGTHYWYRVRAYNAVGNSAWTNDADATTVPAPTPPGGLQGVVVSSAVVDLSWVDNASDESLYRIQRAPDVAGAPGTWANLATVAANVTTYRSTGLAANTTYWYRVRAENAIGNSAYTAGTAVTTLVLVAPSGLTANAYLVGTVRNVDLTWTAGTELTADVYRNGSKVVSARANDGGPYTNQPAVSLALPITYQVCVAGKTGAANCSAVVSVTTF